AFSLAPIPASGSVAGVSVSADALEITVDYALGAAIDARASINGIKVTAGADSVSIPSLTFPPPSGFTITPDLEKAFRLLFSMAIASWVPAQGSGLAALLGLTGGYFGLPADWPLLGPGFLADPLGALRAWLGHIAVDVSADQTPLLPKALEVLPSVFGSSTGVLSGSGIYDDPWAVAIDTGVELLTWFEPNGPPSNWLAPLSGAITAAASFNELFLAAQGLGSFVSGVQEACSTPSATWATGFKSLATWLAGTDGFVPLESQVPATAQWTAGTTLQSSHMKMPSDAAAITQINAQIASWSPGAKVVLLLGPSFSDHSIWDTFLSAVPLKPNFNFRVPGIDPANVDLLSVTDAADFYTVDLIDNGLAGLAAQIGRVVERIGQLRPGVKVTLVAHSTAGIAARSYAAVNAAAVQGLITLGTPHLGSTLLPITDQPTGSALGVLNTLVPSLPAGSLNDAVAALTLAADGYAPASGAGQLPVPAPFPVAAFADPGSTETGGVPALAIGSSLNADLLAAVKTGVASLAGGVSNPAPTHLAFGIRSRVDFGTDGDVQVDAFVRADAGRFALSTDAAEPARPAHALNASVTLTRPDDWLAGSPSSPERVRWMEMGISVSPAKAAPWFRLHDAAFHSPVPGLVDQANPNLQSLLGVVFQKISTPPPSAGSALGKLLAVLADPGKIIVPTTSGGLAVSADSLAALNADPLG
ncbi:MAG TPA: hypothetical protein VHE33_04350, partial [Acidobacteriaceae bacterium]|nr:hypothetical protein [Acidobacteriaceae bacterium]